MRWLAWLAVATLCWVLAGCASTLRLDNDVRSYAAWPDKGLPKAGDSFRFERLPSQQEAPGHPSALEQWAEPVLVNAGLHPVDGAEPARWVVQVSARSVQLAVAPWDDPGRWPGWGLAGSERVVNSRGWLLWRPVPRLPPTPYHQREVQLLMRDAASGTLVYETRAAHDGPWNDDPALWSALLQAAMDGFPQPPTGARKVRIELPR